MRVAAEQSEPMASHSDRNEFLYYLAGSGLEFGPGTEPVPRTPFMTRVEYCDAHDRQSFLELFPECRDQIERFPETIHYRFHFDTEPFDQHFGNRTFDFVIFNHVLEHLVNPLRALVQLNRIVRPDGILFLTLPDPRDFWDRSRPRTSLADVIRRYETDQQSLTPEQVHEHIWHVDGVNLALDSEEFQTLFDLHRRRSIHVNIWHPEDALKVLEYANGYLGTTWELVDGRCYENQFTFILRNSPALPGMLLHPAVVHRVLSTRLLVEVNRTLHEMETRLARAAGEVCLARRVRHRIAALARRVLSRSPGDEVSPRSPSG